MTKSQAILFDIDGVLLDSTKANTVFYQDLFRRAGLTAPSAAELQAHNHLSVPDMVMRTHPTTSASTMANILDLANTITAGYEFLKLPPKAVEVVIALADHYHLGIITNRSQAGVEELWQFTGLKEYFSAVAAFEDTDNHKPDPEPVRYVLERLGVQPHNAVFIGDAVTDLAAAQAAGTGFIMFGSAPVPAGIPVITRFDQIHRTVENLLK